MGETAARQDGSGEKVATILATENYKIVCRCYRSVWPHLPPEHQFARPLGSTGVCYAYVILTAYANRREYVRLP